MSNAREEALDSAQGWLIVALGVCILTTSGIAVAGLSIIGGVSVFTRVGGGSLETVSASSRPS